MRLYTSLALPSVLFASTLLSSPALVPAWIPIVSRNENAPGGTTQAGGSGFVIEAVELSGDDDTAMQGSSCPYMAATTDPVWVSLSSTKRSGKWSDPHLTAYSVEYSDWF